MSRKIENRSLNMEVSFTTLPDSSRIWVYQADRQLKKEEIEIISVELAAFVKQWTAHGASLKAAFEIRYNHFIVIGLDEEMAGASGCSIDSLFRAIQTIGIKTGIDFFNRNIVAFKNNDSVTLLKRTLLSEKLSDWNSQSLTFNNLVETKAALATSWIVPAESTWLKRYLVALT